MLANEDNIFIIIIISLCKIYHFSCWQVNGSSVEFQEHFLVVFGLAINTLRFFSLPNDLCFKLVPIVELCFHYHIYFIFWH